MISTHLENCATPASPAEMTTDLLSAVPLRGSMVSTTPAHDALPCQIRVIMAFHARVGQPMHHALGPRSRAPPTLQRKVASCCCGSGGRRHLRFDGTSWAASNGSHACILSFSRLGSLVSSPWLRKEREQPVGNAPGGDDSGARTSISDFHTRAMAMERNTERHQGCL